MWLYFFAGIGFGVMERGRLADYANKHFTSWRSSEKGSKGQDWGDE